MIIVLVVPRALVVLHHVLLAHQQSTQTPALQLARLSPMATKELPTNVVNKNVLLEVQELVVLVLPALLEDTRARLVKLHALLVHVVLDLHLVLLLVNLAPPTNLLDLVLQHVQLLQMVISRNQANVDKKNVMLELQERMVCAQLAQQQNTKIKSVRQAANNARLVLNVTLLA